MKSIPAAALVLFAACAGGPASGPVRADAMLEVEYPPSSAPGELVFGVTYRLWIPGPAPRIRGIIVHQHGCGAGACKGGRTAADDLHWQALARKWDCALLGPSYHQQDGQNCQLWCDPRNGSERTFLRALRDFAERAGRPEIAEAPWCLWGHSGGGTWASLMQALHPERIVAIWLRSGTAFATWEAGRMPRPELREAVYRIPVMCNPGAKENGDKRFHGAWAGTLDMFRAYRAKGAPIGFAPDPRTSHECGDSRYLAIPYFDACLEQRLPAEGNELRPVDEQGGWLAEPLSMLARHRIFHVGRPEEAVWLPNERVAKAWMEYVKDGYVGDATPPPAPRDLKARRAPDGSVELDWAADADLESGLKGFVVLRDGQEIARLPEKPVGRFGRPIFQTMSYHDTPEAPLPALRYVDRTAGPGRRDYRILSLNASGLKSGPSAPAIVSP
jgi:hypothetical protein